MTSSKKGVSEPCWVGKVVTILNEKPPKVKRIPLGHLSDNVSYVKVEGGPLGRMLTNSSRNLV